jgi:hypothetical protein
LARISAPVLTRTIVTFVRHGMHRLNAVVAIATANGFLALTDAGVLAVSAPPAPMSYWKMLASPMLVT